METMQDYRDMLERVAERERVFTFLDLINEMFCSKCAEEIFDKYLYINPRIF